jgi:hypothetical protein
MFSVFAVLSFLVIGANAFYLPGLAPVTYCEEGGTTDKAECKV